MEYQKVQWEKEYLYWFCHVRKKCWKIARGTAKNPKAWRPKKTPYNMKLQEFNMFYLFRKKTEKYALQCINIFVGRKYNLLKSSLILQRGMSLEQDAKHQIQIANSCNFNSKNIWSLQPSRLQIWHGCLCWSKNSANIWAFSFSIRNAFYSNTS